VGGWDSFLGKGVFSFRHNSERVVVYPTSYPMDTGDCKYGGKFELSVRLKNLLYLTSSLRMHSALPLLCGMKE
jgi:hypothetical protein